MVPIYHSSASYNDLTAEDVYRINSIPNVHVDPEKHGSYALNDLVLELDHFVDGNAASRVEKELWG